MSFSAFLLHDTLNDAINKMGFKQPTEVQAACLPPALDYKDILVSASTGSGKTLAFLIPLIQHLLDDTTGTGRRIKALILVPTRELGRQINKQVQLLTQFTDLHGELIMGGEDPKYQLLRLKKQTPDILIATPGRLLEHMYRETIDPGNIQLLVLDEADRMLSLGFIDQVKEITAYCNPQRQTMLFSASLNHKHFENLIELLLHQPEKIIIHTIRQKNPHIHHQRILADSLDHKYKLLSKLITGSDDKQSGNNKRLVFANTRAQVEALGIYLQQQAIPAGILHGEREPKQRNEIVSKFRNGQVNILVATDVAARGLDIPGVDCVIHFNLARNGEDYAHRSGRTGRGDNTGTAIALIDANEWDRMIKIEHFLDMQFEPVSVNGLKAHYQGPKKIKSSGKAAAMHKKPSSSHRHSKQTVRKKNRLRDRKNIGKRRQPSRNLSE